MPTPLPRLGLASLPRRQLTMVKPELSLVWTMVMVWLLDILAMLVIWLPTMDSTPIVPIAPTMLTTLARGRLTLRLSPRQMLMPTPLPRSTMVFLLLMLSPLDMLTTLDMLPTLLTLPLSRPTVDT